MEKLDAIVIDGKVYVREEVVKNPCFNCDLYRDCGHGMLIGKLCSSLMYENERFRYSQTLTDKINGNGF